jgi:MFS family permease
VGSVLSGYFAGTIGRKKVILLSSVMMTAGWAFIGFSDGNYALLMTGRLIHGFAFLASVSQVYLAEISDAKRRQVLCTFYDKLPPYTLVGFDLRTHSSSLLGVFNSTV